MKDEKMDNWKYVCTVAEYVLLFGIASFIGWAYEIACVWFLFHTYYDRGVLHLPLCPIYGFGVLLLIFLFRKIRNPIILFAGCTAVATGVELLAAYVLEYGFGLVLWTYEGWPLSFQNRISGVSSLIFGLMAMLFIKLVKPPVDRLFSSKYCIIASVMVCALTIAAVVWELRNMGGSL